ncbi:MAG: ankyrin repeat domain-containing protein [Spirochaetaceae bacterium]|nr:MAG: ankyrin repeat domain-containing protein [Spirochaetaceae bacterium]
MRQMRRVLVILIVMTGISCATVDFEPTPIDPEKVNEDFRGAVQSGDTIEVEHLLYMGAEVNKADADGLTPLMFTSYSGHLEVARLLIEAGADIAAQDNNGYSALI